MVHDEPLKVASRARDYALIHECENRTTCVLRMKSTLRFGVPTYRRYKEISKATPHR
jgi:hypothetical protein